MGRGGLFGLLSNVEMAIDRVSDCWPEVEVTEAYLTIVAGQVRAGTRLADCAKRQIGGAHPREALHCSQSSGGIVRLRRRGRGFGG